MIELLAKERGFTGSLDSASTNERGFGLFSRCGEVKAATTFICSDANLIGGESVGATDCVTATPEADDDDDGGDGDPDPDPDRRPHTKQPAKVTRARKACNGLPTDGYVRLPQIIGDPKAEPPILPVIPVSKSSWWSGCKTGRYPAPVKLGPRTTAWRVSDIRALIEQTS